MFSVESDKLSWIKVKDLIMCFMGNYEHYQLDSY